MPVSLSDRLHRSVHVYLLLVTLQFSDPLVHSRVFINVCLCASMSGIRSVPEVSLFSLFDMIGCDFADLSVCLKAFSCNLIWPSSVYVLQLKTGSKGFLREAVNAPSYYS